jgi:hypothetical protein
MARKEDQGPDVTIRACATPAGPCVESTSKSAGKAVLGIGLGVAAVTAIWFGVKALVAPTSRRR